MAIEVDRNIHFIRSNQTDSAHLRIEVRSEAQRERLDLRGYLGNSLTLRSSKLISSEVPVIVRNHR